MPEDAKENKAKKLAAARKKLKEYQAKDKKEYEGLLRDIVNNDGTSSNENILDTKGTNALQPTHDINCEQASIIDGKEAKEDQGVSNAILSNTNMDAIKILITEKAALLTELNKFRSMCREKELESEELQTQFQLTSKRLDTLQNEFLLQQKVTEELKSNNLTLQVQLQTMRTKYEDQTEHLEETKKLLAIERDRNEVLRNEFNNVSNELELATIRINQISDEANISKDNRVESLTQVQFMYEQQIRDLQAMVQQLTRDKEQANQQYQTYVQHLNTEVASLNDKNNELVEECSKLQEREKQLIHHISSLEKNIQKSISLQDHLKQIRESTTDKAYIEDVNELKEKLIKAESECQDFEVKIKSYEDRLDVLNAINLEKDEKISAFENQIQNILSERPDSGKLLATMQSDKIAASRALTQNNALKKQLDELQIKFVELTNDKADLVNKLDAEEYINRETRNNFAGMNEQIKNLEERLHFKDEEMIRLTHENNDLTRKILVLQQRVDRLQHYEARQFSEKYSFVKEIPKEGGNVRQNGPEYEDLYADKLNEDHDQHDSKNQEIQHIDCSSDCDGQNHSHSSPMGCGLDEFKAQNPSSDPALSQNRDELCQNVEPPAIPTVIALQKLQNRFTKLMAQVADLTEEKQRLEHLVLQLQSETETIGEYIALYQTQRRILKQREYEKAAQLQLLLSERNEMREKITTLNRLVSNLGLELPNNLRLNENIVDALEIFPVKSNVSYSAINGSAEGVHQPILDEVALNKRLNSNESKEILVKIQNIITEIKENTKDIPSTHTADHLTCCSGKFEVV